MASSTNPPPQLKAIQPFLKMAVEYDKRDKVIAYFSRLHAAQRGINIDRKSPECKTFLFSLMDNLEQIKNGLAANGEESVSNDLVAQAHVENAAFNLFELADKDDRAGICNKTVVKRFYTANLLFDTLEQFGEQSEENAHRQKYAKWKATYIHKCMKEGTTPVAGPSGSEFEEEFGSFFDQSNSSALPPPNQAQNNLPYPMPNASSNIPHPNYGGNSSGGYPPNNQVQPPTPYNMPPPQQHQAPAHVAPAPSQHAPTSTTASSSLDDTDFAEASKLCKYAISAMQYEDTATAIENLTKALAILKPS